MQHLVSWQKPLAITMWLCIYRSFSIQLTVIPCTFSTLKRVLPYPLIVIIVVVTLVVVSKLCTLDLSFYCSQTYYSFFTANYACKSINVFCAVEQTYLPFNIATLFLFYIYCGSCIRKPTHPYFTFLLS